MELVHVLDMAQTHFYELDGAYWLTKAEVNAHAVAFTDTYFDKYKLSDEYGYTPELALTAQLDEYCRENFGWEHLSEGM